MSCELILVSVKSESSAAASISELGSTVRAVLKRYNKEAWLASISEEPGQITFETDCGVVKIQPDNALFPLSKMDYCTIDVAFQVAQAGNMFALTDGGASPVILMHAEQRNKLPASAWRDPTMSPLATEYKEFFKLVRFWFDKHARMARAAFAQLQPGGESLPAGRLPSHADAIQAQQFAMPRISDWVSEVYLWDLCNGSVGTKRREEVLAQVGACVEADWQGYCTFTARHENQLWFNFPSGSGRVWGHKAVFDLKDLDDTASRLLWDIARIGDMSILTRKPRGMQGILTRADQRARWPSGWNDDPDFLSICSSSLEVTPVLRRHLELDIPEERRALFTASSPNPLEGTLPTIRECVYLELKHDEYGNQRQFKKLEKFYNAYVKTQPVKAGEYGLWNAPQHRLETPELRRFNAYCYSYTASESIFFRAIQEFARIEGVCIAHFINFTDFSQSDGKSFPLNLCHQI